jgi:hypothetical protein
MIWISEAKLAQEAKNLSAQIIGKCSDIDSADENK